jgi:hypothetical protein
MEQVNAIVLADEGVYPSPDILKEVLGRSYPAYTALLELFEAMGLSHQWRYYKDGKAWLCKVQKGTRTIVWMSAWKGFMKATIYFPEKHSGGLSALDLSEETKEGIRGARKVGSSTPCMFEIRNRSVLKDFETVMAYKLVSK